MQLAADRKFSAAFIAWFRLQTEGRARGLRMPPRYRAHQGPRECARRVRQGVAR